MISYFYKMEIVFPFFCILFCESSYIGVKGTRVQVVKIGSCCLADLACR